jgi:hypothetical protein
MPAPLGGPRTDPIRDAVGGERVAVPLEKAPFRGPRQMAEFAFADFSQTAVPSLPLFDGALVDAQTAKNPLSGTRRGLRKAKSAARGGMGSLGLPQCLRMVLPDAFAANAQDRGDCQIGAPAESTGYMPRHLQAGVIVALP